MASPLVIRALKEPAERELALAAFARLVPPFDLAQHRRTCADAVIFEVAELGRLIGYYAIALRELEGANYGRIVAAAALVHRGDLTAQVLPHIVNQFRGALWVELGTHRPGLARKLERTGWRVTHRPDGLKNTYQLERGLAC